MREHTYKKIAVALAIVGVVNGLMGFLEKFMSLSFLSIFQKLLIAALLALLCLLVDFPKIDKPTDEKIQKQQLRFRKYSGYAFIVVAIALSLSFIKNISNNALAVSHTSTPAGSTTTSSPNQSAPPTVVSSSPVLIGAKVTKSITPTTPTPLPTPSLTPTQTPIQTPTLEPTPYYSPETIAAFDYGFIAYGNQEYEKAFPLFLESARAGYPKAALYLGLCYQEGKGVNVNSFEAFDWYSVAAESGLDQAQYCLGYCYLNGFGVRIDESLAFSWFLKSAEQNNKSGLLWTGYCYHKGIGVEQSYDQAVYYYTSAQALGSGAATTRLEQILAERGY